MDAASKAYLRLDLQEKKVQNSAGSFEVYISSNTTWTIESQSEWIKTSRTSGKGNLSVRINYEANESGKRTGALLFKADGTRQVWATPYDSGSNKVCNRSSFLFYKELLYL